MPVDYLHFASPPPPDDRPRNPGGRRHPSRLTGIVVSSLRQLQRGAHGALARLIAAARGLLSGVRLPGRSEAYVEIWSGFSEARAEETARALSVFGIETEIEPVYPAVGEAVSAGAGFSVWVPARYADAARSALKQGHLT